MHTLPDFDRDAIARRIFDEVICHPNFRLDYALDIWLELIEGVSGYLRISTDQAHFYGADSNPSEISAIGEAITRAAQLSRILAEALAKQTRGATA